MSKKKAYEEGRRRVHRDSYIEVKGSYYEVPAQYIGSKELWARWDATMVRVYDQKFEKLATYTRLEKGKFSQVLDVGGCRGNIAETVGYYRSRVIGMGDHTLRWADTLIAQCGDTALRRLQGLLGLKKKYTKAQINEAARKANIHGKGKHTGQSSPFLQLLF
jgi:hypothetical protein